MNLNVKKEISKLNILVFGDYMIDEYIEGDVSRISPEAPVPVLNIKTKEKKIGGAGNVINNIISLGANVKAIGRIGQDENGRFIKNYFSANNVDSSYLFEDSNYNTIIKTRVVSKNQQFIRLDKEDKIDISNDIISKINNNLDNLLANVDVVVISDYAKGNITRESIKEIIEFCNEKCIPVIVDPKGNNYTKYIGVTICTPNLKELSEVSNKKISSEEELKDASIKLINKLNLQYLVLTRSEKGISLIDKKGNKADFPALKKEVIDVSGAGDTVVAALSVFIGLKYDMKKICKLANIAASVVVSKFGTSTVNLDEMKNIIEDSYNDKILSEDKLREIVDELKKRNLRISFTNGCFDLLHAGHIDSLKQAKSYGDILIVGVNSDESVKNNKGNNRPIIQENFRLMMLSSLECVDYLVLFNDETAEKLVQLIKPDFYVKGEEYKDTITPEVKVVNSYGGKCEFIKIKSDISTSKIIDKIRNIKDE